MAQPLKLLFSHINYEQVIRELPVELQKMILRKAEEHDNPFATAIANVEDIVTFFSTFPHLPVAIAIARSIARAKAHTTDLAKNNDHGSCTVLRMSILLEIVYLLKRLLRDNESDSVKVVLSYITYDGLVELRRSNATFVGSEKHLTPETLKHKSIDLLNLIQEVLNSRRGKGPIHAEASQHVETQNFWIQVENPCQIDWNQVDWSQVDWSQVNWSQVNWNQVDKSQLNLILENYQNQVDDERAMLNLKL